MVGKCILIEWESNKEQSMFIIRFISRTLLDLDPTENFQWELTDYKSTASISITH